MNGSVKIADFGLSNVMEYVVFVNIMVFKIMIMIVFFLKKISG